MFIKVLSGMAVSLAFAMSSSVFGAANACLLEELAKVGSNFIRLEVFACNCPPSLALVSAPPSDAVGAPPPSVCHALGVRPLRWAHPFGAGRSCPG